MHNMNSIPLSERFPHPAIGDRPAIFLAGEMLWDDARLMQSIKEAGEKGIGCVIPLLCVDTETKEGAEPGGLRGMSLLHERYAQVLKEICRAGLDFAFMFEAPFEAAYLAAHDEELVDGACTRQLLPVEYICSPCEDVRLLLRADPMMSLVAVEETSGCVLDLRGQVEGRMLRWSAPEGNWRIVQYVCADCGEEGEAALPRVDPLSYEETLAYLEHTYSFFADLLDPLRGKNFRAIGYRDLAFYAPNHRNWSPEFNRVFEERYGFAPTRAYPALFGFGGEDAEHMKALLLDCRAGMFEGGVLRAYADFAARLGVRLWGQVAEPKLPACSVLCGDPLYAGRYAAGALLEKAYLYGANSVKLAAGAAYNFGHDRVTCESYRGYPHYADELLYHEAASAFTYGANNMLLHPAAGKSGHKRMLPRHFYDFIARTQMLLRGGEHVADIAMLYPIYSLHAQAYFYEAKVEGFEYPGTPVNADYMSLISSISIYAGHDLTLLHPETMAERCRVEGEKLVLEGKHGGREEFRLVILPSSIMVSLANLRLLAQFFAGGGKIISTGELPRYAFEYAPDGENDLEVCRLVREIFGDDVLDGNVMRPYDYHTNAAGGEAYHLPAGSTALDGTEMVPGALMNETIKSLGLPYDVLMPGMIHLESTGALSLPYPEFVRLGLDRRIPGKGMLTHIHKRCDGKEIYYFANTTAQDYNRPILLRGAHRLEVWNPYTAEISPLETAYVTYKNTVYTKTRLSLTSGSSVFYLAPGSADPRRSATIESIEELEE